MTVRARCVALALVGACVGCWLRDDPPPPRVAAPVVASAPEVVEPSPNSNAADHCEVLDHTARCRLESVQGADVAGSNRREVVATYRVLDPTIVMRVERRFVVSYLGHLEADVIEHVRANSVVGCRWQIVVRGTCAAAAPSLMLPDLPQNGAVEARREP